MVRETFIDARDESDPAVLIERGQEALAEAVAQSSLEIETTEAAGMQAFRKAEPGDLITVELIPGRPRTETLGAIKVTDSRSGVTVTPMPGNPNALDPMAQPDPRPPAQPQRTGAGGRMTVSARGFYAPPDVPADAQYAFDDESWALYDEHASDAYKGQKVIQGLVATADGAVVRGIKVSAGVWRAPGLLGTSTADVAVRPQRVRGGWVPDGSDRRGDQLGDEDGVDQAPPGRLDTYPGRGDAVAGAAVPGADAVDHDGDDPG